MKMGPREAADFIRDKIHTTTMDPGLQHQANYVAAVCTHLGVVADAGMSQHVFDVLRENDIEIPSGDKYPKWLGTFNGRDMIANDENHEQELKAEMAGSVVEDTDGLIEGADEEDESSEEPSDEEEEDDPPVTSKKKVR